MDGCRAIQITYRFLTEHDAPVKSSFGLSDVRANNKYALQYIIAPNMYLKNPPYHKYLTGVERFDNPTCLCKAALRGRLVREEE